MRSIIKTSYAALALAAATDTGSTQATGKAGDSTDAPVADEAAKAASNKIVAVTDETKVAAIGKAMRSREIFATFDDAYAKLTKAAGESENFYGLPIAIVGYDAEADAVDPAVYEGHRAVLSYVGARVKDAKGKINSGIKAVVIFPIPTIESFLAGDDKATAFIDKVLVKEASHVTFRNFRDAETVTALMNGAAAAPKSVDDYVTASTREGSEADTETFDALWVGLRNTLKSEHPAIHKLLPGKAEVIKAMRSKSYALADTENLKPLEDANIFAKLANALILGAANNKAKDGSDAPLDSSVIKEWLENRDTYEIAKREAVAKDFSILGGELDF